MDMPATSRSARRRRARRGARARQDPNVFCLDDATCAGEQLVTAARRQQLICQLEAGGELLRGAVSSLRGRVPMMALDIHGCRVVQRALELASASAKQALAKELHGHVCGSLASPHGNYVIQKIIEVLPVRTASFVAEELKGFAVGAAQHRFGCRILCRLVEHHLCKEAGSAAARALVDKLLCHADELMRHCFARHVLEKILENGSDAHRKALADVIVCDPYTYGFSRVASYVVENAFVHCGGAEVDQIGAALLLDEATFTALAMHECGSHVVRALILSRAECAQEARQIVLGAAAVVGATKYGRRLLDKM